MTHPLLRLSPERMEAELARVRAADAAERVYVRRRRRFALAGVLVWFLGAVLLGGAFHTTSMEWGSVLLLLGPLVATFGPIAIVYAFWVTSGEL